jgi:hypothetical protein
MSWREILIEISDYISFYLNLLVCKSFLRQPIRWCLTDAFCLDRTAGGSASYVVSWLGSVVHDISSFRQINAHLVAQLRNDHSLPDTSQCILHSTILRYGHRCCLVYGSVRFHVNDCRRYFKIRKSAETAVEHFPSILFQIRYSLFLVSL